MTEKLFYQDSYVSEFEANVLSCNPLGSDGKSEAKYEAVLDRTAFFPEGGGQSSDTGTLCAGEQIVQVLDVQEKDGMILHYTSEFLEPDTVVRGKLDFQERFSKMQQHTGEHIVSGIVHKHFGYKNVGFHLGKDEVTMDYDGPLTQEELRKIEYEANQAVVENIPIQVLYPSKEELEHIFYRSKIEIQGQVRIVQIPGYDSCACCAPHVKTTGSVGIIKLVGAIHYKGGMRLSMLCGFRALADYNKKEESVVAISNRLSAKQEQVVQAVKRLEEEIAFQKEKVKKLQERYVAGCLEDAKEQCRRQPDGDVLLFVEELDAIAMRNFVNDAMKLTQGCCGVFAGNDTEGWKYVLGSQGQDIRAIGKALNQQFQGKGGGKPPMIQGSLVGTEEHLRGFLQTFQR